MENKISNFYAFIGRRTALYGGAGIAVGFLSFLCDVVLAMMLQRFFMATGLVTLGNSMPLGIDLQSPVIEGSALVAIGLVRGVILWASGTLSGLCQVTTEVEKRKDLVKWAISSDGQEVGKVMSYFNDITIGSAAAIGGIFYLLSRVIVITGVFIVMMTYSVQISLLVLLLIAVFAPLQMVIDRVISRHSKFIQSSLENSVSLFARAVKNNLFLSLHNLSSSEIKNIDKPIGIYEDSSVKYYSLNSLRTSLPQILGLGSVVIIAIQGHFFFKDNPSVMIAFLYMVLRLFQGLSDMARVVGNLRLNYPRIFILYKWWNENIRSQQSLEIQSMSKENRNLIGWNVRNLGFVWPNGKETAIQNLSFSIQPASTTLIIGASGAGKTSLFHLLLGLLTPTNGTIETVSIDGHTITPITGRIPQIISYVGPDPFLIAGTVRDQLLIGNDGVNDKELKDTLYLVHAEFVFDFKEGLNHVLTEQGHGLSAGQKQRIALARALLRKPSILLLDEATANLDSQTENLIIQLINRLRDKMTIIMISHRPPKELHVDTIIDLNLSERKI